MQIPPSRVAEILRTAPHLARAPRRYVVNRRIAKLRAELRREIDIHMQPCMVLLDEVVQFFIHFERCQYSRQLTSESAQFAQQISRIRSDAISVRELIVLGQEAPAHVLARSFVEDIELAMAFAIDSDFSASYSKADDQTAFWRSQIGYGKIYSKVIEFFRGAGGDLAETESRIAYHKGVKDACSSHVHSASHSTMRSAFVPLLSHPGMFKVGGLGGLSDGLPRLCLFLAEETHVFSSCCIKLLIKPNPPSALAGYGLTGVFGDVIASAHLLQELCLQYFDDLQSQYDVAESPEIEKQSSLQSEKESSSN